MCRVFTPVGKKEQGKLGLEVATKALDYYAEFFGVAYRLENQLLQSHMGAEPPTFFQRGGRMHQQIVVPQKMALGEGILFALLGEGGRGETNHFFAEENRDSVKA